MSSVAIVDETRAAVRGLERKEMSRGCKLPDARRRVAGKLGTLPGTLRNLAANRLKKVDAALRERVHALVRRELELEIGRLQHELEIHIRTGERMDSPSVGEAQAHLAAAKKLIGVDA